MRIRQGYDVIVAGGGTAGAIAGIAAARTGARTLLVEQYGSLGAVLTLGMSLKGVHGDAAVQGAVLRIFLRAVERCLRAHSPGCSAAARLGAVVFIHPSARP